MTNPQQTPASNYREAFEAFSSGNVISADLKTLQCHILAIAQNATFDDAIQSRDMVQAITLNHLILQHHINGLEKRTGKMQFLVIALTIASLIGTGVQCWLAYKADERSNMESKIELIQNPVQNKSGISKKVLLLYRVINSNYAIKGTSVETLDSSELSSGASVPYLGC